MCERRVGRLALRCVAVAVPLLFGGRARVSAQTTAEFRARYDSILPLYLSLDDSIRRRDSAEYNAGWSDTVHAGALTVLTDRASVSRVRMAAPILWDSVRARFGSAASLQARRPLTVRQGAFGGNRRLETAVAWSGEYLRSASVPSAVLASEPSDSDLASALMAVEAGLLMSELDDSLVEWIDGAMLASVHRQVEWESSYFDLLTAPSRVARKCYEGDFGQCRVALGLTRSTNPAFEWYDGPQRVGLVARMGFIRGNSPSRRWTGPYNDCAIHEISAACDDLLRTIDPALIPRPLGSATRALFLALALQTGGAESFARLRKTRGRPVGERLSASAALPLDSLLARWHASVIRARPRPVAVAPRAAVTALFWGLLLGAVSLRSTRWR
jgi:hypothetical protein